MHRLRPPRAGVALALGLLLTVACAAQAPAAPAPAGLPAGAEAYLADIRSARTAYAYRLNTAGGLLACDSLEASEAGKGCPEIARRWGPVAASWVDSLLALLSRPATYAGSDKNLISYPDLALRFEGEEGWVELIVDTGYRQFWMRSRDRDPVIGLYDQALAPMSGLIRVLLPTDMALDSKEVLTGPERPLTGDYPHRTVAVEYEEGPELSYTVDPRCPAGRGRPCEGDSVRLQLWVGKNGRVCAVLPLEGDSLLVEAAREAAGQWIYRPALIKRRPVAAWTDVWVRFPPAR